MKTIEVGKVNDCTLYAVKDGFGGFCPVTEEDMEFVTPDICIKYDSGAYPGVTDLEQFICNKAKEAKQLLKISDWKDYLIADNATDADLEELKKNWLDPDGLVLIDEAGVDYRENFWNRFAFCFRDEILHI